MINTNIIIKLHNYFHKTLTTKQAILPIIIVLSYFCIVMVVTFINETIATFMIIFFFIVVVILAGLGKLVDYLCWLK